MKIREEIRRDGLAGSFLIDAPMMKALAQGIPDSILCIGYPGVCSQEVKRSAEILAALEGVAIEPALYAHALQSHLDTIGELTRDYPKASACFWMPVSNRFIKATEALTPEGVIAKNVALVAYFKEKYGREIDVALADTTVPEAGLPERVADLAKRLHSAGARNVIVCDSRGIGSAKVVRNLFTAIREQTQGGLEFHPHNDNGLALSNVEIAHGYGVDTINSSLYGMSERGTLVKTENLLELFPEIARENSCLTEFDERFVDGIGKPEDVIDAVYGKGIIVTGSQYRLRNRPAASKFVFGVTTDRFVTAKMLGVSKKTVTSDLLDKLKRKLFESGRVCLQATELAQLWSTLTHPDPEERSVTQSLPKT